MTTVRCQRRCSSWSVHRGRRPRAGAGLIPRSHRMSRNINRGYRTHPWPHGKEKLGAGCKAEGPQIISIICDTRYLRHPRLSDGSRGGVRIVGGPRRGPKRFPLHIWPDTPSLRELVASTAPPGSHDPRSKPRLRARPRRRPGHDGGARATCCPIWRVGDIIWQS